MPRETPLLGWLLAGVIGLAVGVFLGLGVAKLTGRTLAQQDAIIAEQQQRIESLETSAVDLAGRHDEYLNRIEELEKAEAHATKTGRQLAGHLLKSQAVLDMILREPAVRQFMLEPAFRDKFKADWYIPATSFRMIGGRWFFEEMAECGVISQETLVELEAESRAP